MSNILLIFICLVSGYLLKKYRVVEEGSHRVINHIIIYFSLPALTLLYIPKIEIQQSLIYPIITPWINLVIAFLFFILLSKKFNWSRKLTGAVIMMTAFGNTSFMGIPIIQSLYGEEGIKTVIMVDLPGSFVAISTFGVAISSYYSTGSSNIKATLLNVVKFPPFVVFVLSLALNLLHISLPDLMNDTLEKVSYTVVPLALLSVGMQWSLDLKSKHWSFVWLGLAVKLLLVPLVVYLLFVKLLKQSGDMIEISILESAMPSMVVASIVASSYGLKPKYCSMMLGVGIPISFLTIAAWYFVLNYM